MNEIETERIVEMAWEDRTPFEAIDFQFGFSEDQVIHLMRTQLTRSGFNRWRKRVTKRKTKHLVMSDKEITRFKCDRQKSISANKISKR